jgi:predicted metal-dependent hydrolase
LASEPGSERGEVVHDEALIAYTVVRSTRRKRTIEIAIEPGGVVVRAPKRATRAEIAAVVARRAAWILSRRGREPPPAFRLEPGARLPLLGRTLEVVFASGRAGIAAGCDSITITMPVGLGDDERGRLATKLVERLYRDATTTAVGEAVGRLAPTIGATPARWAVRQQERRWGSCSADGTLRFNWRLAMLPPDLVEYVVVHELCHLRHANHSPAFWAAVEGALPSAAGLRKRLRETNVPL